MFWAFDQIWPSCALNLTFTWVHCLDFLNTNCIIVHLPCTRCTGPQWLAVTCLQSLYYTSRHCTNILYHCTTLCCSITCIVSLYPTFVMDNNTVLIVHHWGYCYIVLYADNVLQCTIDSWIMYKVVCMLQQILKKIVIIEIIWLVLIRAEKSSKIENKSFILKYIYSNYNCILLHVYSL